MTADELVRFLGKVTGNGQALEFISCEVLGRVLGFSPDEAATAIRVGQRLAMSARLDLIDELADLKRSPLDATKVRVWLAAARKANEKRNTIVHSAWLGDPASNEFKGALTKKGRRELQWGEVELQAAIDQLRGAVEMARELLVREGS